MEPNPPTCTSPDKGSYGSRVNNRYGMTTVSRPQSNDLFTEIPGWIVVGLGIIFGAVGTSYIATHPEPPVPWTLEFVLGVIPPVVLLYAGYRITRYEFPLDDEWHLLRACLLGGFAAGALALAYVSHAILVGRVRPDLFVLVSASIATGGVGGLIASIGRLTFDSESTDPLETEPTDRSRSSSPSQSRDDSDNRTRPNTPTHLSETGQTLGTLLADRERWYVVERVSQSEQPVSIPALTRELADRTESLPTHTRIRLRHVTLPALERDGLIGVNPRTETVEEGPELEAVRSSVPEVQTALASIDETRDP